MQAPSDILVMQFAVVPSIFKHCLYIL